MKAFNKNKRYLKGYGYVEKNFRYHTGLFIGSIMLLSALSYTYGLFSVQTQNEYFPNPVIRAFEIVEQPTTQLEHKEPELELTQRQRIENYIREVFKEETDNAFAILSCENKGLNPKATNHNRNGSIDRGIFQINSIHDKGKAKNKDMFDYKQNINVAKQIFDEQGWSPWSCSYVINVKSFWQK